MVQLPTTPGPISRRPPAAQPSNNLNCDTRPQSGPTSGQGIRSGPGSQLKVKPQVSVILTKMEWSKLSSGLHDKIQDRGSSVLKGYICLALSWVICIQLCAKGMLRQSRGNLDSWPPNEIGPFRWPTVAARRADTQPSTQHPTRADAQKPKNNATRADTAPDRSHPTGADTPNRHNARQEPRPHSRQHSRNTRVDTAPHKSRYPPVTRKRVTRQEPTRAAAATRAPRRQARRSFKTPPSPPLHIAVAYMEQYG